MYSPLPTLNTIPPSTTNERRTAVIVGSAVGGVALFLILLAVAFCYKRRQRKEYELVTRKRAKPRSSILAGEDDFDPGEPDLPPMLLRPRGSDTGSLFQEGVWPPPSERSRLADPLMAASRVTLDNIVDSVMGPSNRHGSRPPSRLRGGSGSEIDDDSIYRHGPQASFLSDHQRETSFEALLSQARRRASYSPQDESPQQHTQQISEPSTPNTNSVPRNWLERSPRTPQSVLSPTSPLIDLSPNEVHNPTLTNGEG